MLGFSKDERKSPYEIIFDAYKLGGFPLAVVILPSLPT
jgi:hypothetical protein